MNTYTEQQVKELLLHQRHNCQIERNKRSIHKDGVWYVACEDVYNAEEPVLPQADVMPSLPQSDTCPKCSAYDWSYHAGIEKMKCGDCGYEA